MAVLDSAPLTRIVRFSMASVMLMTAILSCVERCRAATLEARVQTADSPHDLAAAIELREGVAISFARERRAAINVDPIGARLTAGTWSMPRPGDAVTFPGGQVKRWEPVKAAADGWFSGASLRGGYLAASFSATDAAVMMLESTGHAMVYVEGEPRAGDIYSTGFVQLPVRVRKGQNVLLFQAGREHLKARLTKPRSAAFFSTADATMPDLRIGEPTQAEAAVLVVNASDTTRADLVIAAQLSSGPGTRTAVPELVPLSVRKIGFELRGPAKAAGETASLKLKLQRKTGSGDQDGWETLDSTTIVLRVCKPEQTHKRTFRSLIDGSLQYFAVVPALAGLPERRPGLVLTLHGAGVEGIGQAQAYAAKPSLHIVAPTNRRPYGFDWEDWGRLDALEVLELAQRVFDTDPRQTYLTGHSMGGHGTWHIGVTYPDRFAAIAPSAGWISMWSYAGAKRPDSPAPMEELMARALGPSDTLALTRNLAGLGVYILHGDADDNVPVEQARRMRQILGEFHPDFAYHEQPGAGHWWGSACVDWPPLFSFLVGHTIPRSDEVRRIDFITASPAVSSRAHWLAIEAQLKALLPSKVHVELDREHRRFQGTTENVARLAIDVGRAFPDAKVSGPVFIELDKQVMPPVSVVPPPSNDKARIWLVRSDSAWAVAQSPPISQKGPSRQGPFKEAFRNRFVLVFGTKGTPEENAWSLARARFDAETFWYRGNGSADIVPDVRFLQSNLAEEFRDRNVILYGHSESNAAWPTLLGESPVQVRRGQVTLSRRTVSGDDLACLFIRPRPGSEAASVAAVSGSGLPGLRLTERLPYFTSGVAYPDCLLLGAKSLSEGSKTPIAAGYFGANWDVESGEFAWRD